MTILIALLLSKGAYTSAFTSYYTFYLIERFGVTVQISQVMLFLYLVVGALGVIIGGMVGDRIGRFSVIWISILGSLPFALLLPYVDLFWTGVLSVVISLIMASAFASILIYAMDLVPHRVGLVGRTVLWLGVRAWRAGGSRPRPACRPGRHHRSVQALRLAARFGIADFSSPPGVTEVVRVGVGLWHSREVLCGFRATDISRTLRPATNSGETIGERGGMVR